MIRMPFHAVYSLGALLFCISFELPAEFLNSDYRCNDEIRALINSFETSGRFIDEAEIRAFPRENRDYSMCYMRTDLAFYRVYRDPDTPTLIILRLDQKEELIKLFGPLPMPE